MPRCSIKFSHSGKEVLFADLEASLSLKEVLSLLEQHISPSELLDYTYINYCGFQLRLDDTLQQIASKKNLSSQNSDSSRSQVEIFVFKNKISTENALDGDINEENDYDLLLGRGQSQSDSSILETMLFDLKYGEAFNPKNYPSGLAAHLDPTVAETEQKSFELLKNGKKKYLNLTKSVISIKNRLDRHRVKISCMRTLSAFGIESYQQLRDQKQKLISSVSITKAKNLKILKSSETAFSRMKTILLDAGLQGPSRTYLSDVYYPENEIESLKQSCLQRERQVDDKLEKYLEGIRKIKDRIRLVREVTVTKIDKQYWQIQKEFEVSAKNRRDTVYLLLKRVSQAYDNLRKTMHEHMVNQGYQDDEVFARVLMAKEKSDILLDQRDKIWSNLQDPAILFGNLIEGVRVLEEVISRVVVEVSQSIFGTHKEMLKVSEELKVFEGGEILKTSTYFSKLECLHLFNEAYQPTLKEINRRQSFVRDSYNKFQSIREDFKTENTQREQFMKRYGQYHPTKFVPALRAYLPSLPEDSHFEEDLQRLPLLREVGEMEVGETVVQPGMINPEVKRWITNQKLELNRHKEKHQHAYKRLEQLEEELREARLEKSRMTDRLSAFVAVKELLEERPSSGIDMREYRALLREDRMSEEKRRVIVVNLLEASCQRVYRIMAPELAKRNRELSELRRAANEQEHSFQKVVEEQDTKQRKTIGEYIRKIEKMNESMIELKVECNKQREELIDLKKQFESEKKELQKRLEESKFDYDSSQKDIVEICQRKVEDYKSQIHTKNKQLEEMKSQLNNKTEKVCEMESLLDKTRREQENRDLDTSDQYSDSILNDESTRREVDMLRTNMNELREENHSYANKYENIKSMLDEEEIKNQKLVTKIRQKDQEMHTLKEDLDGLKRDLEQKNDVVTELKTNYSTVEIEISDWKSKYEKIKKSQINVDTIEQGKTAIFIRAYDGIWVGVNRQKEVYILNIEEVAGGNNFKLQRGGIIIGEVQSIEEEEISLIKNRNLVSFCEYSTVKKVCLGGGGSEGIQRFDIQEGNNLVFA